MVALGVGAAVIRGYVRRKLDTMRSLSSPVIGLAASAITTEEVFTGEPTIVTRILVAVVRVAQSLVRFCGIDHLFFPFAQLISSSSPPLLSRCGLRVQRGEFEGMPVWTLQPGGPPGKHVVAIHGGAFLLQAMLMSWLDYRSIARDTGATVVVPVYALAPHGTAGTAVPLPRVSV